MATQKKVRDYYENMKKSWPIIEELNIALPSLNAFINNVLFENYVLKFGNRFFRNELEGGRMYLYHGKDTKIIVISKKEKSMKENIFLDISGNRIDNLNEMDICNIESKNNFIWSN